MFQAFNSGDAQFRSDFQASADVAKVSRCVSDLRQCPGALHKGDPVLVFSLEAELRPRSDASSPDRCSTSSCVSMANEITKEQHPPPYVVAIPSYDQTNVMQ